MQHTTDEFLHGAGMDDKADEMRRQMEEQEQQPTVRELVEENCRLHDQVHNLTLYLDKAINDLNIIAKNHSIAFTVGESEEQYTDCRMAYMQEYDGMPGYVPLSARGGERNV